MAIAGMAFLRAKSGDMYTVFPGSSQIRTIAVKSQMLGYSVFIFTRVIKNKVQYKYDKYIHDGPSIAGP